GPIFVTWLVVTICRVVVSLLFSPGKIVAFVLHALANRKGWNSNSRQAEVIGAIVISGRGACIRADREAKNFRERLHGWIKARSLGSRNFHFLGSAEWRKIVIIEIEANIPRGDGRMFPQVFGPEQALFFRSHCCEHDRSMRTVSRVCEGTG